MPHLAHVERGARSHRMDGQNKRIRGAPILLSAKIRAGRGDAGTFVIATCAADKSLGGELVGETEGLDVILADEVRKSDLSVEEELAVFALQTFEGVPVDRGRHRFDDDVFRLVTGFDDGLDFIYGGESTRSSATISGQRSILAATDLSSAGLRPTFLILKLASGVTGAIRLVGLSYWMNPQKL